ncbi:hypothetical protein MXD61_04730 [Frankia sp. AgPm24]|uniref:hypothetical protein n=1 Tax=Frankia sp. AgPm24 TaxID=631128 RepID=UPI00200D821C|nr:hypothetical protein [Frankia sp. AgPm24]MCK9921213.1 hypothetical protein [Frankia sp. AgPm24]
MNIKCTSRLSPPGFSFDRGRHSCDDKWHFVITLQLVSIDCGFADKLIEVTKGNYCRFHFSFDRDASHFFGSDASGGYKFYGVRDTFLFDTPSSRVTLAGMIWEDSKLCDDRMTVLCGESECRKPAISKIRLVPRLILPPDSRVVLAAGWT